MTRHKSLPHRMRVTENDRDIWDYVHDNPRSTSREIAEGVQLQLTTVKHRLQLLAANGFMAHDGSMAGYAWTVVKGLPGALPEQERRCRQCNKMWASPRTSPSSSLRCPACCAIDRVVEAATEAGIAIELADWCGSQRVRANAQGMAWLDTVGDVEALVQDLRFDDSRELADVE
jgi:phage FluMu protein Com